MLLSAVPRLIFVSSCLKTVLGWPNIPTKCQWTHHLIFFYPLTDPHLPFRNTPGLQLRSAEKEVTCRRTPIQIMVQELCSDKPLISPHNFSKRSFPFRNPEPLLGNVNVNRAFGMQWRLGEVEDHLLSWKMLLLLISLRHLGLLNSERASSFPWSKFAFRAIWIQSAIVTQHS